jgi:hypothetical protein
LKSLQYKKSALNAENATISSAASIQIKAFRGFFASVFDAETVCDGSIFVKSQGRNDRASRTEGIIRLLLIILWAIVVVVLGFYSGLAFHHH